jgi:dihydrofolate reductase
MLADEDLQRHAAENLNQADALLFGRVTYEMMEAAWRPPARTGARPDEYEFRGAAQAGGPWADVVRGAIEAC